MIEPRAIADWMKAQVQAAGMEGIVLGLSGGIDSAVVGALAKMAVGDKTLGLIMPCHSLPQDADHALLVAKEFDIATEFVDLGPVYDTVIEALPAGTDLATANIKPRIRMITLYHQAQSRKSLVAGTGNRSEIAVGYFTKHGDSGVDMLPIGNLLKVEVRELARELGVPEPIITKPPSAGLWEGQTDEGEMGFTYDELDRTIARATRGGFTPSTKSEKRIAAMMAGSEHKRRMPPSWKP